MTVPDACAPSLRNIWNKEIFTQNQLEDMTLEKDVVPLSKEDGTLLENLEASSVLTELAQNF